MSCMMCECGCLVDTDYNETVETHRGIYCQGCYEDLIEDLIYDGEINDEEDYEEYRGGI